MEVYTAAEIPLDPHGAGGVVYLLAASSEAAGDRGPERPGDLGEGPRGGTLRDGYWNGQKNRIPGERARAREPNLKSIQ